MAERVQPSGKLDLRAAADLHQSLCTVQGGDVVCDLSRADHIGALCLQVLVSAAKSAAQGGHRFEIEGAGPRVEAQMAIMGLDPDTLLKGTA